MHKRGRQCADPAQAVGLREKYKHYEAMENSKGKRMVDPPEVIMDLCILDCTSRFVHNLIICKFAIYKVFRIEIDAHFPQPARDV